MNSRSEMKPELLIAEIERLRKVLDKIGKQMIGDEYDDEYGAGDFQYAYETIVREVRSALEGN